MEYLAIRWQFRRTRTWLCPHGARLPPSARIDPLNFVMHYQRKRARRRNLLPTAAGHSDASEEEAKLWSTPGKPVAIDLGPWERPSMIA